MPDYCLPAEFCQLLNQPQAMLSSYIGYIVRFSMNEKLPKGLEEGLYSKLMATAKLAAGLSDFQP